MNGPVKIVVFAVTLLTLVLAFNNCGKISFSKMESQQIQNDLSDQQNFDLVRKSCASGAVNVADVPISFDNPQALSCEFGRNGNLEAEDYLPDVTSFRGRIEQVQSFSLPEGAIVCGMEFSFENLTMEYDDHFILTFDNRMLAASYDFSPYFEKRLGLNLYSWEKIKGVDWPVGADPLNKLYCEGSEANASHCEWPQTQQFGQMQMRFSDEVFQKVIAQNPDSKTHNFTLVTIGDGDEGDCRISPISFVAKVKYIVK